MTNSIEIYQSDDGQLELKVALEHDTVWLTQLQMTELFGRDQSVLSRHIRNVFRDGELPEQSNMQKMHIAGSDKPVEQLINDNTLVALALLVAESVPEQKELMIRLVEHFILIKD